MRRWFDIFSLSPQLSAALFLCIIVKGAFVVFLAMTGQSLVMVNWVDIAMISILVPVMLVSAHGDCFYKVTSWTSTRQKDDAQSRLLRMIDDMPVAVMTVDPETFNITYVNETSKTLIGSIEHLLPLKADALLGSSIDVFHRHPEHQRRILSNPANLPHNARIKVGPEVLDLKVSAIMNSNGSYMGPMLTWAIVTKEVEAENRIRQLAHYDPLTGLANRTTFHQKKEALLSRPNEGTGLLFIDLDGFKLVNDTKGHSIGDQLLKGVAKRLLAICNDPGVSIGRLGGDEFAVLVPHNDTLVLGELAERIIDALSAPYVLDGNHQIQVGASIGIALSPLHGESGETLLAHADIALYAAKASGKGTYRVFSDDMARSLQEQAQLQVELRECLSINKGLFVFYQPIIDVQTKQVTSREALIRWHHAERGWISPAEFVPIAEQNDLIDQIGEFVLNTACRDAAQWEDGARVAVNISAAQLGKGTIASSVLVALTNSGLPAHRLEIEVTETAMLNDEHSGICDLRRVRGMGVRIALDDFGTGYSSLTHLRAFPFDKIKIDGSFVKDAVERPESAALVRAIADLGKRLGVTTVAEGVETEAHLNRVLVEGCTEVQGYFYGRPVPSDRDAATVAELNNMNAKIEAA